MAIEYTVKQFADREQVASKTVRRWIDKGALVARKTHGGHWRIAAGAQTSPNTPKRPATV